mgnify:CR=1 FL=1
MNEKKTNKQLVSYITLAVSLLVIVLLEYKFFANVMFNGVLIGDEGDARLNNLLVEHWFRAFGGKEKFSIVNIFYPITNTLAYTDMLLALAIPYSILRLFGMNMFLANKIVLIGFHIFGSYSLFYLLKKKFKLGIFNPLLISIIITIIVLAVSGVDYDVYNQGARYLSWFLTPATVCLAIPLYKQLHLLKKHGAAVAVSITSGVATSAVSIFLMCRVLGLSHTHYVTLLPKSITTAIGMGVSEEAGGIVTLTVISIIITGVLGNMVGETVLKLAKIDHPVAKGLAFGTSAHAVGTAKALELGEVEGAMSSLSIAVAGLLTVIAVPIASKFI